MPYFSQSTIITVKETVWSGAEYTGRKAGPWVCSLLCLCIAFSRATVNARRFIDIELHEILEEALNRGTASNTVSEHCSWYAWDSRSLEGRRRKS